MCIYIFLTLYLIGRIEKKSSEVSPISCGKYEGYEQPEGCDQSALKESGIIKPILL
jgi:hypothetical protein